MTISSMPRACSILVIAYHPDEYFYEVYENLARKSRWHVLVYDNGGTDRLRLERQGAVILGDGRNDGIGIAINAGLTWASDHSSSVLVTFDQDSRVLPDTIDRLVDAFGEAQRKFDRVACLGPVFYDVRNESELFPIVRIKGVRVIKIAPSSLADSLEPSSFIITSGMVINLSCLPEVGGFDEDFFIDYVDTEWCLRAVARGYFVINATQIRLPHSLSDKPVAKFAGRLYLEYSDLRRYYQNRNAVLMLGKPHVPFGYKFYLLVTLVYRVFAWTLKSSHRKLTIKACLRGIFDGLRGRSGKYVG